MSDYTPTVGEVRDAYAKRCALYLASSGHVLANEAKYDREDYAEFDRFMSEHDRQVAERAWDRAIAMVAPDDVDILYAACPYRAAKGEQK